MSVSALWKQLAPNGEGLVTAVITHASDGRVLMLGYMNQEALGTTIESGRVTFWSRSRRCLWQKGESSGNTLALRELRVDCDGDALLIRAEPRGPTCHTGADSCFYRTPSLEPGEDIWSEDRGPAQLPLRRTFEIIEERRAGQSLTNADSKSYVQHLLEGGATRINAKIREEAEELCEALSSESNERVAQEAADLLFHAFVGLAHRDVTLAQVAEVLRRRHGVSGIDERAGRGSS